jgi:aminopeptidase N
MEPAQNWIKDSAFDKPNAHHLTEQEATLRESMLDVLDYNLDLQLTPDETYTGKVQIKINMKQQGQVFVDFYGQQVKDITVNGKPVEAKFNDHMVTMDQGFELGENLIVIDFLNTYVTNSAGLHRFQDPEDNQIYLYTHLEPYFCNRWFPCFDQPCFRAPLTLSVTAPKDW